MDTHRQIAWRRFLVEGTVIVFSILLAFWIDAWWEESRDRDREVMLLQALLDDLQGMRNRFDTQRIYNEAILDAAKQLLEAGASRNRALSPKDVDEMLGNIVWYNTYTSWESASMDLLVSSGDLADLSDLNLVQLLLVLHNRLESAQRRCRLDETYYRDRLIPFLGTHANLPQILATIDHAPGVAEWSYDFPEIDFADTTDHTRLLSNDEFLGLLAAKIDLQHDILQYSLGDLDEQLDRVIQVLKVNLDK
jgi:hypothetical protein